jgi:hypothetical protein
MGRERYPIPTTGAPFRYPALVQSAQRSYPDNHRRVMQGARGRIAMLTAAYDVTMDSRKAFLSVGGFVSSAADW